MRLHQRMTRAAAAAQREAQDFWVDRVLFLLSDEYLRAAAMAVIAEPKQLAIECNFVDQVWDNPRVVGRIKLLEGQGMTVTRQRHETTVAGRSFSRSQLVVAF